MNAIDLPYIDYQDSLNTIAIDLGLRPFPGSTEGIPADSDYGIIMQKFFANLRRLQVRGWWFNTALGVELGPDSDFSFSSHRPLRVTANRYQDYVPRLRVFSGASGTPKVIDIDTSQEPQKAFTADVIFMADADEIPPEALEFIETQTVIQLATIFNAVADENDEARAWIKLLRAHSENEEAANLFDNPHHWHTSRRR